MKNSTIYSINDISFAYTASGANVLNDVNLQIDAGEILTILGRNGAGKSTLFGCMMGALKPQKGKIFIRDKEISTLKEKEIAKIVGYVPQVHIPTFGYTVYEFILMGCASQISLFASPGKKQKEAAQAAMEQLKISHLAERPYTQISGGERQQATIARAIVSNPNILLFDEPTAHLDVVNQIKVLRVIKNLSEKGFAIAITTHDPNHAILLGGNTAVVGREGKLISGLTKEVVTKDNLKEVYGEDIQMSKIAEAEREICFFSQL